MFAAPTVTLCIFCRNHIHGENVNYVMQLNSHECNRDVSRNHFRLQASKLFIVVDQMQWYINTLRAVLFWGNIKIYFCHFSSFFTYVGLILGFRQWGTALLCKDVSHWLGANLESALNYVDTQGLYSLSGKTSYRQISWSLEAARLGVIIIAPLWNSTAALPRGLSNFRAIGNV